MEEDTSIIVATNNGPLKVLFEGHTIKAGQGREQQRERVRVIHRPQPRRILCTSIPTRLEDADKTLNYTGQEGYTESRVDSVKFYTGACLVFNCPPDNDVAS